jgi:hypothetical protein
MKVKEAFKSHMITSSVIINIMQQNRFELTRTGEQNSLPEWP